METVKKALQIARVSWGPPRGPLIPTPEDTAQRNPAGTQRKGLRSQLSWQVGEGPLEPQVRIYSRTRKTQIKFSALGSSSPQRKQGHSWADVGECGPRLRRNRCCFRTQSRLCRGGGDPTSAGTGDHRRGPSSATQSQDGGVAGAVPCSCLRGWQEYGLVRVLEGNFWVFVAT